MRRLVLDSSVFDGGGQSGKHLILSLRAKRSNPFFDAAHEVFDRETSPTTGLPRHFRPLRGLSIVTIS
jgi:hypothetical protein